MAIPRVPKLARLLVVCAAAASLLAWPVPGWLTASCAGLGVVAASLRVLWPKALLSELCVGVITVVAVAEAPIAAYRLQRQAAWPRWQPTLTFFAAQILFVAALAVLRARRLPTARQ